MASRPQEQETVARPTALWGRLQDFPLDDPGVAFPFSRRLARENGWSADYTRRVIGEYKRFLYLCAEAVHPVTPSDEVDQAWHLHLCYTRSYWDDVCGKVVGRPIHHGPTRGGGAEDAKFGNWYARTLETYAAHFGHAPPPDIWPAARVRFDTRRDFRRVDVSRVHLVPRTAKWQFAAAAGALALCGCALFGGDGPSGGILPFILFSVVLLVVIRFASNGGGRGGRGGRGGSGSCGAGCSAASGCGGSGCGGGGCGGS